MRRIKIKLKKEDFKKKLGVKDGRDGVDGKTPTMEELLGLIKPLIPEDKSDQIAEKILSTLEARLPNIEEIKEAIKKEMAEEFKKVNERISRIPSRGMKKITYTKRHNLTSQVDGVTKDFTLPADTLDVIGVWGTQFPVNFNPGTDWTFSGRTLTLTSEVSAPQTGQTLWCMIETMFYG